MKKQKLENLLYIYTIVLQWPRLCKMTSVKSMWDRSKNNKKYTLKGSLENLI